MIATHFRVAAIYLFRSFSGGSNLPSQNFFTITPGVQASLGWRFSPRWTAVARGRLNYLFYNVDKNQSLGYAEIALGVDYAFGF